MDGVLVDSRVPIARSMVHALTRLELTPPPDHELHTYIGPPLHDAFAALVARLGADAALVPALVDVYRERYQRLSVAETEAMPGVAELLDRLAARPGLTLGVVTSKPLAYARPILAARGLDRHMRVIEGPSLEARGEAKTVTLGRALAALAAAGAPPAGAAPTTVAMIGDRWHDVAAGRAHGVVTIGVLWGIGSEQELREAGADAIVATPEDLEAYLTLTRR